MGWPPALIGASSGAFISGAATMLGRWLDRWQDHAEREKVDAERRSSIKAGIVRDFVSVATGLIGAQQTMDAALGTIKSGGQVPTQADLSNEMPRPMQFTEGLGSDTLILLSPREVGLVMTLQANLSVTRTLMLGISTGKEYFGLLSATTLRNSIAHNMRILAEAFEVIAPSEKLALADGLPEPASELLRRLAGQQNSSAK
jgi:hypothetical protein